MAEAKENPVAKRFIDIAGKDKMDERARRTLAKVLVKHAVKSEIALPYSDEETEGLLASAATEDMLYEMVEDMQNMTDFKEFVRSHGAEIPESGR